MCQEFYQIFNNLIIDKGEINKNLHRPIAGIIFILKYKFFKILRNIIVFNIKKFLYAVVKKGLKNG